MKRSIIKFIFSISQIQNSISFLFSLCSILRIRCNSGSSIKYNGSFLYKTKIKVYSNGNFIIIHHGSYLNNCSIAVYGANNTVIIGEHCSFKDVEIHIKDDNNEITIGRGTTIAGKTHLACIEGTKIKIGEDCMFSKDITFRTGDSHSILNEENGLRINPSEDIIIGNHVWIGNKVIVTKGTVVGDNSIVGTGSIVTKAFDKTNIVIAGSPASIVKDGVSWLRERI